MRNRSLSQTCLVLLVFIIARPHAFAQAPTARYDGKIIIYVNSYHKGYPWSDGIFQGIETVLKDTGIKLIVLEMDTKRNPSEQFKKNAAERAKTAIDTTKPDIVIASDDNASKYLIAPHYKNSAVPFVFCGVNWDASEYGFPANNITGMIEVQLIDQILDTLKNYAKGEKIGFIKGNDLSARREATFYEKRFNIKIEKKFVADFSEWKRGYLDLQKKTDMMLVGNAASIPDWDPEEARRFVETNTSVPTGNWDEWMKDYSLVTYANDPTEQGEWAARTALKILDGISPARIAIVTNKKTRIHRNMRIAKKLDIVFPIDFMRHSRPTMLK